MTVPRLLGFAEYWTDSPPVNETVAAYLRAEAGGSEQSDPNDLLALYPRSP